MTLPIDDLPPPSYDGIEFPYSNLEIRGALDHVVHKYLHRNGAELESMGRHIYEIHFDVLAHKVYKRYPDMYPLRLNTLINRCESGKTLVLVVPPYGQFKAKAISWTRSIAQAKKSGEAVKLVFLEDNVDDFQVDSVLVPVISALPTKMSVLSEVTSVPAPGLTAQLVGLLDDLKAAVGKITAQRDAILAKADFVVVQCERALALCGEIDVFTYFKDPINSVAIGAFYDVWDSIAELANDRLEQERPTSIYLTESMMSVAEISVKLYRSPSRAQELMRMNFFDNATQIPPQFPVSYYPDA